MSRILPSATAYRVQHGPYWAVATQDGFNWILDRQISDELQPGVFTKEEADFFREQFPDCTIHQQQPYSDISSPNNSPEPEPEPIMDTQQHPLGQKKRRPKLVLPKQKASAEPDTKEWADWLEHVPSGFLWLLLFMILVAIGIVLFVNCQPFIEAAGMILGGFNTGAMERFLTGIPLVGGLIAVGLVTFVGTVWYLTGQLIEIAPTIMTISDKRTLRMINAIAGHASLSISPAENSDVAWLKSRYNNRPIASLQFFRAARLVVYTIELIVCWLTKPPVQGSPLDFLLFLVTGQFSRINWGNVLLMLSVLFLVEKLLQFALHVYQHIQADRYLSKAEKGE